jgi:phosphatidylglycerol:prolipoprotein diacylglycerol transferase
MIIVSAALLFHCIASIALPGHLHLAPYPVIATAGILAALWLSMHTARRAGLSPDRVWDAGVFAVAAAFVVSRILGAILFLVIEHGHITLSFMDVLNFSSISYLSLLVTAVLVFFWLRWRRLPLLRTLDAWSTPAALLWAALSFADAVSGADLGMPTYLPWGVRVTSIAGDVRVHPIALYFTLAALLLCVVLYALTLRPHPPGRIAAIALLAAGLIAFALDMLRAPEQPSAHALLDTSQWIALAGILTGAALLSFTPRAEAR